MVSESTQLSAEKDKVLVHRFTVQGDTGAFNEIVNQYSHRLFQIALSIVYSRSDAEEVVQDTFVSAYRALKDFRGESSLSTWLFRIVTNQAINRSARNFRRKSHMMVSLSVPITLGEPATFADLLASPEDDFRDRIDIEEFSQKVQRCIKFLAPCHREILVLRVERHFSYKRLATHLGINKGTVKSRIARARESLRKLLERER